MALKEQISSFTIQCVRVWHLLRKPSMAEWKTVSKVSAIGMGLIGLLGFLITIIMSFVYPK